MNAITLHQPWATMIAYGLKRLETRSWPPPKRAVGQPLAIHAGKRPVDKRELFELLYQLQRYQPKLLAQHPELGDPQAYPLGAIVATCRLGRPAPTEAIVQSLSPIERVLGNYQPGRYAWHLHQVERLLEPVPASGKQGVWVWEEAALVLEPASER